MSYRIGIDVGGTNTDAVILDENLMPVAKAKTPTTADVTGGIYRAMSLVLQQGAVDTSKIKYAMLGTTHCTNAVVERKRLNQVAVIRIGLPATGAIKPLTGWPQDIKEAIGNRQYLVGGGHEFDGREIAPLDEQRLREIAREIKGKVDSVAITAVFAPVTNDHEVRAAAIIREELGDIPVSLSHEIGSIGLLERENATVLNASLVDVARTTAESFIAALEREGIKAKVYFGQNDGTLMAVEYAMRYPILTIACGPTNSIRGASFLAKQRNALVVDVGGTTTDVGVLVNGFPRESSVAVEIGGVRTNFRMPDLISIGLGGGTIVRSGDKGITIGPDSVGYRITREALVFGGDTLTTSDVVTALGKANIGDPEKVKHLAQQTLDHAYKQIIDMAEDVIDRMKTSAEPMPVILVGGGSIILPDELAGASEVIRPEHFDVANAIGAAIAQVSGQIERIFSIDELGREGALKMAKELAVEEAVKAGADPASIEIVEIEDVPLAYLPGNATKIRVKAAGSLLV
ncbi:Hydantoinase/oxoprolinase [Desulfotomaculum nigrificans CO-1-SRB]|uniref:Hydantoinase/oxoprolinase n=1 Tax=Desulfotomaculum nigrificans (strain DSM 14880 / VKM B-2319 / CO-1-SRB) TaxID=868595 RepID=F6B4V1_DESCC|nr:hydantoinase/oxoprolinase family protein [Desulfotomaculum nigrificans]AEF95323.1 Hydantoinase/oxoprolinase [Desulfotomaculum nigrificans CO-1-SRB]